LPMLHRMKQAKQKEMRTAIEKKTGPIAIQFSFRKLVDASPGLAIVDIWEARADIGIPPLIGLPPWAWH
jgi:hypothetical protein